MRSDPVGPHMRARLERLLGTWARRENYLFPTTLEPARPSELPIEWIADFVALVEANVRTGDPWQPQDWQFELGMSFGDLMKAVVLTRPGAKETISSLLRKIVAPAVARAVVTQALWPCQPSFDDEQEVACCLRESGARDKEALARNLGSAGAVADLVVECAERELEARSIRSFFYVPVPNSGFRAWSADMWTGYGINEKARKVPSPDGSVEVKWARYEELVDSPVKAFEWSAQLLADGASDGRADAGASGMVYAFPRHGRAHRPNLRDLLVASDAVADTDVLQVSAFINQYPDAESVVRTSDLCFVWLWERRNDAPKGTGTRCLLEAVTVLRSQFASLKTLVVCVAPGQFYTCGPFGEPAQIAFERLEAVDKLASLVDGLTPLTGMHVRGIVNRHEGSVESAALALMALADPQLVR